MVGQPADGDVGGQLGPVAGAEDPLGRLDERGEHVGVEDGVHPLEHRQGPLEPHAGVDVLLGQVDQRAVGQPAVLHEHEVPELDVALLGTVLRPAGRAELLALVEEQLRARAARAGIAHLPEVVLAQPLDPLGGDAARLDPQLGGLVVGLVHGHPHPLGVDAQHLGRELPGQWDRPLLEVVAEAEVPEHLEERVVTGRDADEVDVDGPEALLHRSGAGPGGLVLAGEVRLERDHAGDGEQHRGVPWNQAGRRHELVAPIGEEPEERRAQLVGVHQSALTSVCTFQPGSQAAPGLGDRPPSLPGGCLAPAA